MNKVTGVMIPALVLGLCTAGWATVRHVPSEYPTIQAGIDAAVHGDTVLVAVGTYTGDGNRDIDFGGKGILVASENGAETTIIDCQADSLDPHYGVYFENGEDSSSVLRGFTITNAWVVPGYGAGVFCQGASPVIEENIITGNHGGWTGGGICAMWSSSPTIRRNSVIGNASAYEGGGIFLNTECMSIVECNIIAGNSAQWGGGMYCGHSSSCTLEGNTFAGNQAVWRGGAIYCRYNSSLSVVNSILWGDSAALGEEIIVEDTSSVSIRYSDVEGGSLAVHVAEGCFLFWEDGNMDADPLFVVGPLGEYYLSQIAAGQGEDSPCVDAGDPGSSLPEGTTRTDEVPDALPVDMGYHYPVTSAVDVATGEEGAIAPSHSLAQNYPNPFSTASTIVYSIAAPTQVDLSIYDISGALVRSLVNEIASAGSHRAVWDGRDGRGHEVASGVYFYRLQASEQSETKRMVLLR